MMKINTNHSNLAFEEQITKASELLKKELFSICGYPTEILHDRLMQRLVEISYKPYATRVKNILSQNSNGRYLPGLGERLDCDRAVLEIGSGKIMLTTKQWMKNQYDFLKHWFFSTISIFNLKPEVISGTPADLVFGVGDDTLFQNGSDMRFVKYCRSGQIEPLTNGKRFYIESRNSNNSVDPKHFYCRWPLINLLRDTKLGFSRRLCLVFNQFLIFFEYLIAAMRLPQLSLIAKDFAYSKIALSLDKVKIINSIVLTCSNYTEQPLFTRGLANTTVHMIWYAQNWNQITYTSDNLKSERPNLRWIRTDIHWVWTHSFSDYLKKLGIGKRTKIVGPIVWYLPEADSLDKKRIRIVVFDVSPFSDEIALGNGQITNYHHPDNLFAFIRDLIAIKADLEQKANVPVEFILKTKRGYNPLYDKGYFDYLDKLALQGVFRLANHSVNLYSLISGSNLVIAYPFTSPAYIADDLGVSSIYYDPTSTIVRHDFGDSDSLINFCSGYNNLFKTVHSLLSIEEKIVAQ